MAKRMGRRKKWDKRTRQQIDEIEVLTSIYGDDWHVDDEAARQYYIDVKDDSESPNFEVRLQITLPAEYPSGAPPQYSLNGPWLRGESRMEIENALQDIYVDNIGDSILYLWVERVREFLQTCWEKSQTQGGGPVGASGGNPTEDVSESLSDQLMTAWTDTTQDGGASSTDDQAQGKHNQGEITAFEFIRKKPIENIPCPEIYHSEFLTDRKSKFQAHLAAVNKKEEIEVVRNKLLENRKIQAATHNIIAYRIRIPKSEIMYQSCEDDGEFGAGGRVLHLLNILEAENVMVIVTRWYGGIHLGPDRFKHINNMAREILLEHGYVKEKGDKKGPRSTKKR